MTHVMPVVREEADRYRGRLPDGLLDFWVQNGRGAWLEDYAWLCDPEFLRPVVEAVFEGHPKFEANGFDCYMYTFDRPIYGWSAAYEHFNFDLTAFDHSKVYVQAGSARQPDTPDAQRSTVRRRTLCDCYLVSGSPDLSSLAQDCDLLNGQVRHPHSQLLFYQ
ncbi:GAD-like domain-containing protein [uncultured Roseobacter sp.]|uniref:GAD-like domain-containing protein n=1 Tax=uncultured Roseobacter sp. TaxID=114847 RepID=UPI00261400C1|nr:GAD-like domain-containing protein [uncultured Roseobacter sp.]